jgi:hypothetical protein
MLFFAFEQTPEAKPDDKCSVEDTGSTVAHAPKRAAFTLV